MIIYDRKIAYLCTVCVNSVPTCTVHSIFIFFFNLKENHKKLYQNVMNFLSD